jgi:cytochrome P450
MYGIGLLQTALLYCLTIIASYFLVRWSYRALFHPLRKYPGPLAARLTNAYGGYHAYLKRSHLATYANHLKYGEVVRHGPNRLVFNTVTALHDIYTNPNTTKAEAYHATRQTPADSTWTTLENDEHKRKRKIISQPISEKAMRAFEPTLVVQLRTYAKQLLVACRKDETLNMTTRFEHLAADIIGHLAFGYALDMQTSEANRWLMWALSFNNRRANVYMQFPALTKLNPIFKYFHQAAHDKYRAIGARMIQQRTSMDKDAKPDLYAYAMNSQGGQGITGKELWAEAFFFVVAGGETSATCLAALCFYLTRYPECYARLRDEIRGAFSSEEEMRGGARLAECVYLRACINEALRLAPPASGMMWRQQVTAQTGSAKAAAAPFVVDGHVIPRGTDVAVNVYAIHHNEAYFPDPFTFNPDRWLTPEAADPASPVRRAFCPFLVGGRACAGKALAYLEIGLALAYTLYYFDFERAPGKDGEVGGGVPGSTDGRHREDEYQLYEIFSALHDGPKIVLKEREGFCDELASL